MTNQMFPLQWRVGLEPLLVQLPLSAVLSQVQPQERLEQRR